MDVETLACHLILLLAQRKPEALTARFKIVPEEGMSGWDLLEAGRSEEARCMLECAARMGRLDAESLTLLRQLEQLQEEGR